MPLTQSETTRECGESLHFASRRAAVARVVFGAHTAPGIHSSHVSPSRLRKWPSPQKVQSSLPVPLESGVLHSCGNVAPARQKCPVVHGLHSVCAP